MRALQDISEGGQPVALKFFRDESQVLLLLLLLLFLHPHPIPLQFAREVEAREWLSSTLVYATTGADTCVVPMIGSYSAAKDEVFKAALQLQPRWGLGGLACDV